MVSSEGQSGGLALLWKPDTKVHVKKISRWFINAHVFCETTGICWRLTGFYGHPETSKREETWTLLESLGQTNHLPWLCIGDLNEITNQSEKAGGCLRPTRQMDRFRTAIHHCNFIDLGYVGSPFTWSRNHPVEGRIHIRLDRALANMTWKALFPNAIVHHVSMLSSVQTTPCSPSRYSPPDLNNHDPDLSSVLRPCGFKTHDAPISSKKHGTKVFLSQVVLQSPTVMPVAVTD